MSIDCPRCGHIGTINYNRRRDTEEADNRAPDLDDYSCVYCGWRGGLRHPKLEPVIIRESTRAKSLNIVSVIAAIRAAKSGKGPQVIIETQRLYDLDASIRKELGLS